MLVRGAEPMEKAPVRGLFLFLRTCRVALYPLNLWIHHELVV